MDAKQYYSENEWNHNNQPARTNFVCKGLWGGVSVSTLVRMWGDYFEEFVSHSWARDGITSFWLLKVLTAQALSTVFIHDTQLADCYASAFDFQDDMRKAWYCAQLYVTEYSQQQGWL